LCNTFHKDVTAAELLSVEVDVDRCTVPPGPNSRIVTVVSSAHDRGVIAARAVRPRDSIDFILIAPLLVVLACCLAKN